MELESSLERIKKPTYLLMLSLLYICYFAIYAGLFYVDPTYVSALSAGLRLFICAFLIYKFHPFRQHRLLDFDAQLIFASAIWILTDMGFTQYIANSIKRTPIYDKWI